MINQDIEVPYHIPKEIKDQLQKSVRIIKEEKQDRFFLITGREGSGKSLLGMQLGYYCSLLMGNKFGINNLSFTSKSFSEKLRNYPKNSVIIFDEAFRGLSSKGALSKENKELVKLLIECRQRGHIIFIILPSLFLLEKYVAIFRAHGLFNVLISKRNYKNRYYKSYNYENKKLLYMLGQKYMSYSRPKIYKKYRFYGKYPETITEEEYNKVKLKTFMESNVEEIPERSRAEKQRNVLLYYLHKHLKMKQTEIAKTLIDYGAPIDARTVSYNIRETLKILPKPTPNI